MKQRGRLCERLAPVWWPGVTFLFVKDLSLYHQITSPTVFFMDKIVQTNNLVVTMTINELKATIAGVVKIELEGFLAKSKQSEQSNFLNKKEAARLLSCSTSTIDNLARSGNLTRHYVGRKGVRFDREQVLSMAEQTIYYKSVPNARR